MYELPHELPNDLRLRTYERLRKLGNFKKISEMLGFDGEYPAVHPKAKFKKKSGKKIAKNQLWNIP